MAIRSRIFIFLIAPSFPALLFSAHGQGKSQSAVLQFVAATPLPGFSGDFDHFAVDEKGQRLFLAGEDHKTVEVFDLLSGKHLRSISGFGAPHSIFYLPESNRILITDGDPGSIHILSGSDYTFISEIKGLPAADSARLDTSTNTLYVVTGGKDVKWDHSFLAAISLGTDKKVGELRFDSNHVEALALESSGPRLFINLTDRGEVDVVNRKTMKILDRWPVQVAGENSPMAYDELHRRLFVVCRKPAMLVVMDSDSGKVIAHMPAASKADDVAFDVTTGRIYVPGGEGFTSVFEQKSLTEYSLLAKVPTAPGAKTCLLEPSIGRYFVAVSPGETKAMAKLMIFRLEL
jgi:hypothetical protein